jgi:acyl-CoA reductase-like NAD-dependent aldehyde dehydrogenase
MKTSVPQLLVGGRWLSTADRLAVTNPYTGEEFARVPMGNAETIDLAIGAAASAFPRVKNTPAHQRATLLNKIARGIEERRSEFVETVVNEGGKPVFFAEAEVSRAVMTFQTAAEEARRQHGEMLDLDGLPPGEGHLGFTRRFPLGVISAITPFNFPLNLVAHKVAPCIATGNTMVVKPATKTPLTALLLAQVLQDEGTPDGQINFITCSNEDAGILITDERVKKITFTGSPAVGWKLKTQCGKKRITLELGGNAGCIVHADADLDTAIPLIALGGFGQAGQSCISVQRVVVHESIYDTFRERFAAHVKEKVKTGDPRDHATVVGPMITRDALEKIHATIKNAVANGAKIVLGGNVTGQCLEATVIENAPANDPLCAEEAFAPIVTLHRYSDFDKALAFVNDSDFGLQAGVFTRDLKLALRAFETLEVGGVLINQVPTFRVENMPYGGVKDSGFGREGVRWAMEEMTEVRSCIIRNV